MSMRMLHLWMAILIFASAAVFPATATRAQGEKLPELAQFIDDQVIAQMETLHIANAAVAIVSADEVLFLKGYGAADLEEGIPVDAEKTLFRVGSVSKLFTWTAVMQLVEQGKLDLNADVNKYLDFEVPAGLLYSDATPGPITLTHLMTHTAGFEAYPDEIFRLAPGELLPLEQYVKQHLPERVFPPGEVAAYSNYGAALAGYIVERVSGQPFEEYVEQHIFAPLGMAHSTFRMPAPAELTSDLAQPYRFVNGAYLKGAFEFMQAPEGGMSSTAADMAKFMQAHLQSVEANEGRILQPETLAQMHTRQPGRYTELGGMTLGFMEGTFNGQRVLFHGGATMVFDTGLYLLPEEGLGVFITYSGANHLVHTALFQQLLDRYFPAGEEPAPAPTKGMLERARSLAGEYQQNTRSFTTDEKFNSLAQGVITVRVDNAGDLLITHVGETNRFVEIKPGTYRNRREGRTQDYFGPFRTVVFDTDPFGQTLLVSDGPMTYSRAPWYATSSFTFLALGAILVVMVGTLLAWSIGFVVRRLRRKPAAGPKAAAVARGAAMTFVLLTLIFVVTLLASGAPDPVYHLPAAAYQAQPASAVANLLPWMLVLIGAAVLVLSLMAWAKGYWKLPGRIHYSLIAASALLLAWIFFYWNAI